MPQLEAGRTYTGKATMTNPTNRSFSYTAELYLGLPKVATSGVKSFTLAAGQSTPVSFSVKMPNYEGTFPVYLDVFVGTDMIAAFEGEAVATVIPPQIVIGPITWE